MKSIILGIESSCDDTSAAVICGNRLLSNVIASQAVHEKYGGVIPELASRHGLIWKQGNHICIYVLSGQSQHQNNGEAANGSILGSPHCGWQSQEQK